MDVEEIKRLIELFEQSSLTELVLERGQARLSLRRESGETKASVTPSSPVSPQFNGESSAAAAAPASSSAPQATEAAPAGHLIRSPIVGTYYRRPSPDEDPYVEVGDHVDVGDTVCIIEAMKVMNEVKTDRAGLVKEMLTEDGSAVEFNQPLLVIDTLER